MRPRPRCIQRGIGIYVGAMRSRLNPPKLILLLLGAACASRAGVKPTPAAATGPDDSAIRDVVSRVARHQVRPLKDGEYPAIDGADVLKTADAAKLPDGVQWVYPWGVTLYGVLRSTDATADKDTEAFVLEHNQIVARDFAWL